MRPREFWAVLGPVPWGLGESPRGAPPFGVTQEMFDLLKRVRVKVVACACLGNHIGPSAEPMQFNPVLPQPRDRVLEMP